MYCQEIIGYIGSYMEDIQLLKLKQLLNDWIFYIFVNLRL